MTRFEFDAIKTRYARMMEELVTRVRDAVPGAVTFPLDLEGSYTPHKGPYVGQALPATVHIDSFDGELAKGRISISHLFDGEEFTLSLKKGRLEGSVPSGPMTYGIQMDLRSVRPVLSHRPPALRVEGAIFMNDARLGDLILYLPLAQLSRLWHR